MRGAEANLQALINSSVSPPAYGSDTTTTNNNNGRLPFSAYLPPLRTMTGGETASWPYPHVAGANGGGMMNGSYCHNVPNVLGIGTEFTASNQCRDPAMEEREKARNRQLKAALRKQRNKEAARRSNLNKKLIREELEQKSVELWEENIQLHQDIRDLSNQLRHFRHMRSVMQHVCHSPPVTTTAGYR